jgi:hypothetical protein
LQITRILDEDNLVFLLPAEALKTASLTLLLLSNTCPYPKYSCKQKVMGKEIITEQASNMIQDKI